MVRTALLSTVLCCSSLLWAACNSSAASPSAEAAPRARTPEQQAGQYRELCEEIADRRATLVRRWQRERTHGSDRDALIVEARKTIEQDVLALSAEWLGTRWGLGAPQSDVPGAGQINCGTFVGTVLHDAGFVVDVRKLQRQPSQLIISS